MQPLGGEFEKCARAILAEAAGEEPPEGFPTAMLENMIDQIVNPSGRTDETLTLKAIMSMACLSKGGAKELSNDEIKTIIGRYFTLQKITWQDKLPKL